MLKKTDMNRFGVIIGSGIGGIGTLEKEHEKLLKKGPGRVSPFLIPMMIGNIASGHISMAVGAKGPNTTVVTACASATNAIGDAFKAIQRGDADLMFTGGCEASITPIGMAGFCTMKAMSTRNDDPKTASRPFDTDRDGFVMGEGAGIIILEELNMPFQEVQQSMRKWLDTVQLLMPTILQVLLQMVKAQHVQWQWPSKTLT